MLEYINKKVIFTSLLIIFLSSIFSIQNDNDSINLDNKILLQKLNESKRIIDSLKIECYKKNDIDRERSFWLTELAKSNTLFTVFIAVLLFVFGFGYFAIFKNYLEKNINKIDEKVDNVLFDFIENELLVFRSMYFNCINLKQYDSAILWGTRILLKEVEKDNEIINNQMLVNFVANILDIFEVELVGKNKRLSLDIISEISQNILLFKEKCSFIKDTNFFKQIDNIKLNLELIYANQAKS